MHTYISIHPKSGDFTVLADDDAETQPVQINLGPDMRVFMEYADALELSRALRVACGVEEPKAEEVA